MTPKQQLEGCIDRYSPEVAAVARGAMVKIRRLIPPPAGAFELVYDNSNALAIGWSPTERASDVIASVALYPRWVSVFLMQGARLPDPDKRLAGKGNQVRHIKLEDAKDLDDPAVQALIAAAVAMAGEPEEPRGKRTLIIKSVSARQRARRPG